MVVEQKNAVPKRLTFIKSRKNQFIFHKHCVVKDFFQNSNNIILKYHIICKDAILLNFEALVLTRVASELSTLNRSYLEK